MNDTEKYGLLAVGALGLLYFLGKNGSSAPASSGYGSSSGNSPYGYQNKYNYSGGYSKPIAGTGEYGTVRQSKTGRIYRSTGSTAPAQKQPVDKAPPSTQQPPTSSGYLDTGSSSSGSNTAPIGYVPVTPENPYMANYGLDNVYVTPQQYTPVKPYVAAQEGYQIDNYQVPVTPINSQFANPPSYSAPQYYAASAPASPPAYSTPSYAAPAQATSYETPGEIYGWWYGNTNNDPLAYNYSSGGGWW